MDNSGTASLIGFLTAGAIFTVSFAMVVQVSFERQDQSETGKTADRSAAAANLASTILGDTGAGWYSGSPCDGDGQLDAAGFQPDEVLRLGLGEERCAMNDEARSRVMNLSFDKLQNLFSASYAADPANEAVDYAEARAGLGLEGAGYNFHIRSWPLLPSVSEMLKSGYKDPNLRPIYIGDYERAQGHTGSLVVPATASYVDGASSVTLHVTVTNDGSTSTAFSVTIDVPATKTIEVEKHTPVLAPDAEATVDFVVPKTADWHWKDPSQPKFDYTIRDPSITVGSGSVSMAGVSMTGSGGNQVVYVVESSRLSWVRSGASVKVDVAYAGIDGAGSAVSMTGWALELLDGTGTRIGYDDHLKAKGGTSSFTLTSLDTYTARILKSGGAVAESDFVLVVGADLPAYTPGVEPGPWAPESPVALETAYVAATIEQFARNVPDADYASGEIPFDALGDVLPDDNQYLADFLPATLLDENGDAITDNYNILFVGTNVDHRSLTSSAIKYTIRDWVLAGGTLVVFGSENQAVQWLEPLFHVALDSASEALFTPDENHPILNVPNDLDPSQYDAYGTAWHFTRDQDRAHFAHVVVSGQDDVLTVSDPGAFGLGRVLLTSWQPYDLTTGAPQTQCATATLDASCAALQLIDNFMTLAYRGLYLDYGPAVPTSVSVGVQAQIVQTWHPELHQTVEMYVVVYVF